MDIHAHGTKTDAYELGIRIDFFIDYVDILLKGLDDPEIYVVGSCVGIGWSSQIYDETA